ncbi:hypothetical protein B0T19DRAFT_411218 [Cercophora scortea]|uniref:Uncharacterized protein n=1 Tax=Cercophora scortea TaxID=314031 RepID=A0AAE0MMX8_9PEZI|nr:hypothetical protein B0T19DRAFT_411218 [Cercophora scortea]
MCWDEGGYLFSSLLLFLFLLSFWNMSFAISGSLMLLPERLVMFYVMMARSEIFLGCYKPTSFMRYILPWMCGLL